MEYLVAEEVEVEAEVVHSVLCIDKHSYDESDNLVDNNWLDDNK